jgi:hypothetical protein
MITAVHALLYSEDPPATRAFLRDVIGWPYLEDANSEPGWSSGLAQAKLAYIRTVGATMARRQQRRSITRSP